jgi:hypothetical protein
LPPKRWQLIKDFKCRQPIFSSRLPARENEPFGDQEYHEGNPEYPFPGAKDVLVDVAIEQAERDDTDDTGYQRKVLHCGFLHGFAARELAPMP